MVKSRYTEEQLAAIKRKSQNEFRAHEAKKELKKENERALERLRNQSNGNR